ACRGGPAGARGARRVPARRPPLADPARALHLQGAGAGVSGLSDTGRLQVSGQDARYFSTTSGRVGRNRRYAVLRRMANDGIPVNSCFRLVPLFGMRRNTPPVAAIAPYRNGLSRSHLVATHFSPSSTGEPACRVRVMAWGRA